ncbi:proton-conducting transporter membrane subunit [Haliangium ochraceum]|uniref:NADH dehydrogenase (Quinone) n=1 Tax=Haliangium ochraceum (strain DSM 14365 / JCM 11303 / SMP-2) TaxID=502025 RepID=D0LNJ8_HALO1|nr:proton-conducting transporter membrane subunit [Haliangium ochraceum]ACY16903.1 NADH dehydrogenase (quinone) [Haliangium ochraceum DSM 14365]
MIDVYLQAAAVIALAAPTLVFGLLAVWVWFKRPLREQTVTTLIGLSFTAATLACLTAVGIMAARGIDELRVPLGSWLSLGHFHLHMELMLDRLSLPFATFGAVLVGIVAAFSRRYMHRERGFVRFYVLLALLGSGFELVVLAGSLDIVVLGWELIGVTSAMLIAFFHHRPGPVRHGLRAFVTYRVCDVALITAVVWLHHVVGSTGFGEVGGLWAGPMLPMQTGQLVGIGLLLIFATLGKSAQVPLTGWLPRAMEGPTSSSAIFYGALSIHLGPYLLLRMAHFLEASPALAGTVVAIGALTVLHASLVGRVQTDIKSALAYASVTQVGLIFVEIGLGLRFLAIVHIVGHASVRTLQILRSPSLLYDHQNLERAVGQTLPHTGRHFERLIPDALQPWFYRFALERGYLDALLRDYVAGPLGRLLRGIDRMEQQWCDWLGGRAPAPAPVDVNSDASPNFLEETEVAR